MGQDHQNTTLGDSMKRSSATRVVRWLATAVLIFSLTPTVASAATTRTITGVVTCANGNAVVGIWVHSTGGGSGWASFTKFAGQSNSAYFTKSLKSSGSSTTVKLDVGCGGTAKKWWSNNSTPNATVKGNRVLNTQCSEKAGKGTRCTWPPKGVTVPNNRGAAKNCTWGALNWWKGTTGYYPATAGNAGNWDNYMPGQGWRISRVPAVRSFVIFEASTHPTVGHVGWVIGVKHVGSGQFDVTMKEMNVNGELGSTATTTFRHKKGTHDYILATV